MVRKFLYFVAMIIIVVIAGGFVLSIWSTELTRMAMVPRADFVEQQPFDQNAYLDPDMWYSRPGIGTDDPARWQPATQGVERTAPPAANPDEKFAVFFIHPTSFIDRTKWNAPLDDVESQRIARVYLRGMASPFNQASEIWAPKYRQATFGAFLADSPEAKAALEAAYADVKQSFAVFSASVDPDTPIVLAGHSQGALHLMRLLREEVAGKAIAPRMAAVYAIGWPISVEHDLPALGFPACATADQPGCIMSWSSFAEPADPSLVLDSYRQSTGLDGNLRGNSKILCTNPLTGGIGGIATADKNLGTLVPNESMSSGELVTGAVPARCDYNGLLLIGDPPQMGSAVLPGNNYHVYDIPLFWENLHQNVAGRVAAWNTTQ